MMRKGEQSGGSMFDTEPKVESKQERKEQLEKAIEQLILNAQKVNEGNNGVIAQVDMSQLSAELTELVLPGVDVQGKKAMKLLKVFRPGMGYQEASLQKEVYQIVSSEEGLVHVPDVHIQADISVQSAEVQAKLRTMGISATEKVHVLIMDLVNGFDLATILYREVVKRHHRLIHLRSHVNELSLDELIQEVGSALQFETPSGKQRDEAQRAFAAEKVFQSNAERLMTFLKRDGFTLDPNVLESLEKTIDTLHKHGIAHRDLHERNIMIDESGEAYLIDFGNATKADGPIEDEDAFVHADETTRFTQDKAIIKRYRALATSLEEDHLKLREEMLKKFERTRKRIEGHPAWKQFHSTLETEEIVIDVPGLDRLITNLQIALAKNKNSDFAREIEVIALLETERKASEVVRHYIDHVLQDKTAVDIRKNLLRTSLMST